MNNRDGKERAASATVRAQLDPFRPQAFFVENERAASGEIVPVVTLFLTNRECPWRCIYCDLWKSTTTDTVPPGAISAQIDHALNQLRSGARRQIKLYNAGSFFDPKAIPPEDLPAVAERARQFERVVVESHPALIAASCVHFRDLLSAHQTFISPTPTKLEVAMGLEIADDALLERMNKRMTLAMFRQAATFLIDNGIDVRAFVIIKPPFVRTDAEALDAARRSIDFAFDCGATVVSLIPARFGPELLNALAHAGDFSQPGIEVIEAAVAYGIMQRRGRVFVDLWDIEKLGGCKHCLPERAERLREMNFSQTVLPRSACSHGTVHA